MENDIHLPKEKLLMNDYVKYKKHIQSNFNAKVYYYQKKKVPALTLEECYELLREDKARLDFINTMIANLKPVLKPLMKVR